MINFDNNPELRRRYHELNNLTHAFVEKEGEGCWSLYFGTVDRRGFKEDHFRTKKEAFDCAKLHHPELIHLK